MEMPVSNAFAERDRQGISFQAGPPANLEISWSKRDLLPRWLLVSSVSQWFSIDFNSWLISISGTVELSAVWPLVGTTGPSYQLIRSSKTRPNLKRTWTKNEIAVRSCDLSLPIWSLWQQKNDPQVVFVWWCQAGGRWSRGAKLPG